MEEETVHVPLSARVVGTTYKKVPNLKLRDSKSVLTVQTSVPDTKFLERISGTSLLGFEIHSCGFEPRFESYP
jgi:hypothetical protein